MRDAPTAFTPRDLEVFRSIARRAERDLDPRLWDEVDLRGIAPERLERARLAWVMRAEGEARALEFDRRFGEACAALGMPPEVRRAVARIERDEARHVELCARVSERLGAPGERPALPGQRMPSLDDAPSPAHFARWAVVMFCLGEVCAAGIARALLAAQTDRATRASLRLIARDEAQHERFGWALARGVVPALTDDERDWLAAALAHSLAFYELCHVGAVGGRAPAGAPDDERARGHEGGVVAEGAFARAFYGAVESAVLPGLARLGVPAREAWALRAEAAALWAPVTP